MLSLFPRARLATRIEEHFGLARRPFALTLDQHFVYPSRSSAAALADVRRALDRRDGLVVVTGATGTGKTMLCRTLVHQMDPAVCVSLVLDPCVTVDDLLRHVLADFGVFVAPHAPPLSRHQLMRALQRFLAALVPAGACAVLIVDEAQHLDPDVLAQICLLLNLETDESKLLQVVLVGDPSLDDRLARPESGQLQQRVARRPVLEPLSTPEVGAYIQHRLATAQRLALAIDLDAHGTGQVVAERVPCSLSFTPGAMRAVARHSQGIPRVVNLVCDRALEIAYERALHSIRTPLVHAAARQTLPRGKPRIVGRVPRRRHAEVVARIAGAVAVIAVGAVGVGAAAWQTAAGLDAPGLPPAPPAFVAAGVWRARPDMGRIEVFDQLQIWNGAIAETATDVAPAADPRLLGVALLREGRVVSVAVEMTAEPRRAVLHRVSDRVFDLELGPVAGPVRSGELVPASEVPLVAQLSIREHRTPGRELFVRARVMLRAPGHGDIRVAGRVVYVDIQPVAGGL